MSEIDEIIKSLDKVRQARDAEPGKRLDAFQGLLTEISSSLVDMVEVLEKGTSDKANVKPQLDTDVLAQAFAKAIGDMKVGVDAPVTVNVPQQAAPKVEVSVSPTPVNMVVPAAAPPKVTVNATSPWAELSVDSFTYNHHGQLESFRVRRI